MHCTKRVQCKECCTIFSILQSVRKHAQVSSTRPDAVRAIEECKKHVMLFMAHQIRASVHIKRILEIQGLIQNDVSKTEACCSWISRRSLSQSPIGRRLLTSLGREGFLGMALWCSIEMEMGV